MRPTKPSLLCLLCVGCRANPPSPLPAATVPAPPVRTAPAGVEHRAGADFAQVRAHYGVPILQRAFFWDGNGETDNCGLGLHCLHHVTDWLALGGGVNATAWLIPGADAYSGDVEGLLRIYPDRTLPWFLTGTGGYLQAHDPVPPGGTEWNFTFSFGPGIEIPAGPGSSLVFACDFHHVSNALGHESSHNPSQNEARAWLGFAWTF